MTYPGLTSRHQRHTAAFQFHLARIPLTYVRQRRLETDPDDTVARRSHAAMREEALERIVGMRTMLHALFD